MAFQLIKCQVNCHLPFPTIHSCYFHYEDFTDYHYFINLNSNSLVIIVANQKLNSVIGQVTSCLRLDCILDWVTPISFSLPKDSQTWIHNCSWTHLKCVMLYFQVVLSIVILEIWYRMQLSKDCLPMRKFLQHRILHPNSSFFYTGRSYYHVNFKLNWLLVDRISF